MTVESSAFHMPVRHSPVKYCTWQTTYTVSRKKKN